MTCRTELRGFEAINDDLTAMGVTLVAISVDPPERSRDVVERDGLPFSILADERMDVIGSLGLVHRGGGPGRSEIPGGSDIAIPAHVLVDADGRVLWKYVSDRIQNRLVPRDVLEHVRASLAK